MAAADDIDLPNSLFEPYDARAIEQCLEDWALDSLERQSACEALSKLIADRRAAGIDDAELTCMVELRRALVKFAVREDIVKTLDQTLPAPDGNGVRTQRVEYGHKAGGDEAGRAYALGRWQLYMDGKLRCLALQGLPADLRPRLTGFALIDLDGVASDMALYVILAREAGLPDSVVSETRAYLRDRDGWHRLGEFNVAPYDSH